MAKRAGLAVAVLILWCSLPVVVCGCAEKWGRPHAGECPEQGDTNPFVTPDPYFPDQYTNYTLESPGEVTSIWHHTDKFVISIELTPEGEPPLPIVLEVSEIPGLAPDLEPGDQVSVSWQQGPWGTFGSSIRLVITRNEDPVIYYSYCRNCSGLDTGTLFQLSLATYGGVCEMSRNDCTLDEALGLSVTCDTTGETLDLFGGNFGTIDCGAAYSVSVGQIWRVVDVRESCINEIFGVEQFLIQRNAECGPDFRHGFLAGCGRTEGECIGVGEAWCSAEGSYEFCGCDGIVFSDPCRFPDRAYAYPGECVAGITDSTPPCGEDDECGPSELCAFGPGCAEPERHCAVNTCGDAIGIPYCGCNGETFATGCSASDRPYAYGGSCDDSSTEGDALPDATDDADADIPSDVPDVP